MQGVLSHPARSLLKEVHIHFENSRSLPKEVHIHFENGAVTNGPASSIGCHSVQKVELAAVQNQGLISTAGHTLQLRFDP
jgi:hypothetical protein